MDCGVLASQADCLGGGGTCSYWGEVREGASPRDEVSQGHCLSVASPCETLVSLLNCYVYLHVQNCTCALCI